MNKILEIESSFRISVETVPILHTQPEVTQDNFPRFLFEKTGRPHGVCGACMRVIQFFIKALVYLTLRPRSGAVGALDQAEVDSVYTREAARYDLKHHLTTRGMDTVWRRAAGWAVATYARERKKHIQVLDLCSGTGLSLAEIMRVGSEWGVTGTVIGIDYNEAMRAVAEKRQYPSGAMASALGRADATRLTRPAPGFCKVGEGTCDVVTQIFGIGGISEPERVFTEVLKVLVQGGQYLLVDMHQPIPRQPGEVPTPFGWLSFPRFEAITYRETTVPLALQRLWGWRDTTMDFHLLPLMTWSDQVTGEHWGFKVLRFEVESERWWFGLPIMPVGKILVEKVLLTSAELRYREELLSELKSRRSQ